MVTSAVKEVKQGDVTESTCLGGGLRQGVDDVCSELEG